MLLAWLTALPILSACDPVASEFGGVESLAPAVTSVDPPASILFIGNSFTYWNEGVDRDLERLAASMPTPVTLVIETRVTPSQNLRGHYEDSLTADALSRRPWDVVVLQGSSFEPAYKKTRDEFYAYADLLHREVQAVGASTVFFMTWAYRDDPDMTDALYGAYVNKANELGALVVPVGLAWELVGERTSDISLYSDHKHPSVAGTYLAACVFYASLFGTSPEGAAYRSGIPADEALLLQRSAWDAVREFVGRN